ncbi:MAG: ACT domain-containing protein [Clostridiales bacterium]|nr:ACT domain-containing protein [Clostridiales bacterium]
MTVKQISVFLENKKGRLVQVTNVLSQNNIDISAISIAETTNFGIIRMIVNKPQLAVEVLKKAGFTVNTADVLAVEVPDCPGGLHQVLEILSHLNVSIEYLYSFVRRPSQKALILFKLDNTDRAIKALKEKKVNILSSQEVYEL